MSTNKTKFLAVFTLFSALLFSGVPLGLLPRANALQFIVSVPHNPNQKIIVVAINNPKAAQAVSQNSSTLQPQPALSVSPLSVAFNTTVGVNPGDPVLTIANTGPANSVLNWSAVSSALWIGLSQASGTVAGGSSTDVVVGADVSGLGVGTYQGTIEISDPIASNSPQSVDVTLNITEPPPAPAIEQLDHSHPNPLEANLTYGRQLITIPGDVVVGAVGLWVSPASGAFGSSESNLNIYTDSDGGLGNMVATSNSVSLDQNDLPGEVLYTFNPTVALAPGNYWLVPSETGGNHTQLWGSSSDVYAGGYWYYEPFGGILPVDAYFRFVTQ